MIEKEWTIMVYMAGDNNLSEDMITGLKGMMSFAGGANLKNINLIALYDGNYPPIPVKIYNFSNSIASGSVKNPGLEDFVDKSFSSSARTSSSRREFFKLKEFVPLVLRKFKAKRYGLILSGHSDGIIGKTFLRDENPDIVLDLKILKNVLKKVLPEVKGKKKKFELLGFDGCLMNMLEVGYELRDVANVLVASEGNIPTSGWAYEKVLADLVSNHGAMDEKAFALSIVNQYARFNEDYAVSGRSINISACNLNNIKPLYVAIQKFAKHLYHLLDLPIEAAAGVSEEDALTNKLIREKFIDWMILSHYKSQTFMHGQSVDIVDFIYNLLRNAAKSWLLDEEIYGKVPKNKATSKIEKSIILILDDFVAINEAMKLKEENYILANCFVGAEYQFSKGTSIFFPWTEMALNLLYNKYTHLEFNRTKHWLKLIDKFTNLTIRQQDSVSLNKKFISLFNLNLLDLVHKELGGRELGGRELGGRGGMEAFYTYFSQIRNYDSEFLKMDCVDDTSFI